MATFQYRHLPQINMGESRFVGCGPDTFSYTNVYDQDNVNFASECNVYFCDLDDGMVSLPPVPRSFQYHYPPAHGLLQALPPVQRQIRIQYEPQWPSNDCFRTPSPDRSSASEYSTDASLSDVHSPHVYHAIPYASPTEGYSPSLLPFPTTEHLKEGGYPTHPPLSGGSINLQMIEYEHPELESGTVVDDVDRGDDFKQETVTANEDTTVKVSSPASDLSSEYPDSGLGNSLRDAESVQPIDPTEVHDDPESDEDYSPKSSRSTKRRRSCSSTSSSNKASKRKGSTASSSSTSNRASKRTRRASATKKHPKPDTDDRPFPCPLAPYGCDSTFSSKNEWKRHVSTQHIKLFYWRCDLCAPTTDAKNPHALYYNDFNRKDLYTQHIRRMHAAPKGSLAQDFPVTEDNRHTHQARCFTALRNAPLHSCCLFCDKTFEGPASWDERMEHVGRHLEKDGKAGVPVSAWNPDEELERYLLEEGLVVREGGEWRVGDGRPVRRVEEQI